MIRLEANRAYETEMGRRGRGGAKAAHLRVIKEGAKKRQNDRNRIFLVVHLEVVVFGKGGDCAKGRCAGQYPGSSESRHLVQRE